MRMCAILLTMTIKTTAFLSAEFEAAAAQKRLVEKELAFRVKINRTYMSKLETGITYFGLE